MQDILSPHFIDRDKEHHKLTELLLTKRSRLILIQGAPGSGKTTFARAFLNTQDAETFWLSLQQVSQVASSTVNCASPYLVGPRWQPVLGDGVVNACQKAQYVVVDDADSFSLPDILELVMKCTRQQFILLSLEALDLPADADRIVLLPLTQADVRHMVETWATVLRLNWTPQQMSDFLERYSDEDANPRRILQVVEAMREAGGFGIGLNALQPFMQAGLLDASGQPLSNQSSQFLEVVSNVKFVNSRLLDDVRTG